MPSSIHIRLERASDYRAIRELIQLAFLDQPHAEGDEQDFVERLRISNGYRPDLALVAALEGEIVAHIMLTETAVQNGLHSTPILLLAELSVSARYRRQGIASRLMREAFERARHAGFRAVMVVGDPQFYGSFGFRLAVHCGIVASDRTLDPYLQALELVGDGLGRLSGTVWLPP